MADINSSLKDYLSSNQQSGAAGHSSSYSDKLSKLLPSFKASADTSPLMEDTTNQWIVEAKKDPCLPTLTRQQRAIGFVGCLLMGTFCFSLASLYIPFLILKARKFAMLYTLGSLFIIFSFSLLWGPVNHFRSLLQTERLPFTSVYFGTLFATLYFSLWVKSTLFTVIFAALQIIALIWYIVSAIPGGQTGLNFFSKVFYMAASKTVSATLPV